MLKVLIIDVILIDVRLGACLGFFVDLFAFRPRSPRIRDLRRATAAARPVGHHGLICFLNGRLLSRSAPSSRIARPDLKSTETVRNTNRPRIALEILSLKNEYDHGA